MLLKRSSIQYPLNDINTCLQLHIILNVCTYFNRTKRWTLLNMHILNILTQSENCRSPDKGMDTWILYTLLGRTVRQINLRTLNYQLRSFGMLEEGCSGTNLTLRSETAKTLFATKSYANSLGLKWPLTEGLTSKNFVEEIDCNLYISIECTLTKNQISLVFNTPSPLLARCTFTKWPQYRQKITQTKR